MNFEILRPPATCIAAGLSKSKLYANAASELFTPPVKVGPRAAGWPRHEVEAINKARIAGKTDAEIRALVKRLVAARAAA